MVTFESLPAINPFQKASTGMFGRPYQQNNSVVLDRYEHSSNRPSPEENVKKFTDEGDYRSAAPNRDVSQIVEPVSNSLSTSGKIEYGLKTQGIPNLDGVSDKPQHNFPTDAALHGHPPPSVKNGMVTWQSRQEPDGTNKAKLEKSLPKRDTRSRRQQFMDRFSDPSSNQLKEDLAKKFIWKSVTQRAYEDVPWDDMLEKRLITAGSTKEQYGADPIAASRMAKSFEPPYAPWRLTGQDWDYVQRRRGHYDIPVDFRSHWSRGKHIPNYGGHIPGRNPEEIDNGREIFDVITVKRSKVPRYAPSSYRPNIPGYTGSTYYEKIRHPAHSTEPAPEPQTTRRDFRYIPLTSLLERRSGAASSADTETATKSKIHSMSRSQTTVPPANPFSKTEKFPHELHPNRT